MSSYKADLQQILELVEEAEATGKRVDEHLASVDREVASLGVHWHGDAKAQHEAKHQAWMKGAREMREALTELKTNVSNAHEVYSGNIAHNVGMWP
ncbi:MAG: WXG100 family type VII secretion target [Segniliparus sp.]|uniref:WXG100 family type VII secretion target n=1 Tax=Segniliparus sp. TaxID=2804064 RepID=UPI003F2F93A4